MFIPIALMNWGHYMSLLWGFQLCYVLPVVLACMLLLLVSQSGERLLAVRAVLAGGCAAAAALCGGAGIFFSPVVAVWLVAAGLRQVGARTARRAWRFSRRPASPCFR